VACPREIAENGYNYLRIRIAASDKEITDESDAPGQVSPSVDTGLVGKVEGMCKLLPRTMQNFAFTDSKAFFARVLVCTKCFR
jgi:hypothetical protein